MYRLCRFLTLPINVEGVIYVYPFNSSKTFFCGSINSSDYVFDYENYIIFYGILGNKFPEYTISIDSRKENISYYIVSFYGDLDFNDFIYVEYNENCKTKINSDTKLDQPGEYTIYTSYLNKHELEENFNDRYKIK